MRAYSWWTRSLLVATLLLGPAASDAMADTPFASATLYEVREAINCNPGPGVDPACADDAPGFGVRIADATLVGGPGTPLPGGMAPATGSNPIGGVTMDASSILSQVDWTGPVHGKFTVTDGTRITFSGQLNLSLAVLAGRPLAPVSGNWQATRGPVRAGGTFAGVFLIPFACPPLPDGTPFPSPTGACYLDPSGGAPGITPVRVDETSNGIPLVKLGFTLTAR